VGRNQAVAAILYNSISSM